MNHSISKFPLSETSIPPILRVWLPRLVIAGVLGASILIGLKGSASLLARAMILMVVLVGVALLIWRPVLGLLGVVVGGFFISYSGPGGVNITVVGIAGLTALWLFLDLLRYRTIRLEHPQTAIPLLVFMVVSVISFVNGQILWYPLVNNAQMPAQVGGLFIFILSACAFLFVANQINGLRWLQVLTWLFVFLGALFILARVVPQVGSVLRLPFQPGATSNSSIFWVWILVIPFSQMLVNNRLHLIWRLLLGILAAAMLYASVIKAYDWKSGYLPPLAGVATVVALLLRRKVFLFLPLLLIAAIYASTDAVATDEYSYITRVDAWQIVLELTMISPLFGLGFANYYWYTPLKPILGWSVSFNSHSQYVDLFAQVGLVGVVCFIWVFWSMGLLGWYLKDRVPEGFAKAYVYGALGGLVGTLVAGVFVDWVLPFVYNIGMSGFRGSVLSWLFLGGLVVIYRSVLKNEQETTSPS